MDIKTVVEEEGGREEEEGEIEEEGVVIEGGKVRHITTNNLSIIFA
jgi:hypothetical protein